MAMALAGLTFEAGAQNANQTTSEEDSISIEISETGSNTEVIENPKTANDEAEPSPEEVSQDRIFRPSEDISEDLVIAFPVDI